MCELIPWFFHSWKEYYIFFPVTFDIRLVSLVHIIVQFTMYRLNFSFFLDLQNYTFLESLEPTEPEK